MNPTGGEGGSSSPEAPEAPEEFDGPAGAWAPGGPDGIGDLPWEEAPPEPVFETGGEPGADPATEFRRTLGRFATGVTVVTTMAGDQVHGMTANAFMSVSLRPPLVLISVDKRARMHPMLHVDKTIGISVLGRDQEDLSDHFAGRARDHQPSPRFESVHDTPLVGGAIAHLVARIVRSYWGGDHSLFIGQVEYAKQAEGTPLLFHGGQYEHLPLSQVSVFAGLPAELQRVIVSSGEERRFGEGEAIVAAGDEGDLLFVLLEGRVRVERGGRALTTLEEGEVFGEVSVLDGGPRTADVIAATAVRVLTVSRPVLRQTLLREPDAAWSLLQAIAGRLRPS